MALDTGSHGPATLLAAEATSLGDLFRRRVARDGARVAYFDKVAGAWQPTTWRQWSDRAARFAAGLAALGLEPGDRVAIAGPTRPEWVIHEMGAQLAGCVSLGIYPASRSSRCATCSNTAAREVITVAEASGSRHRARRRRGSRHARSHRAVGRRAARRPR
ncbi:MAG: AMP-binding protein [bacterium]